MGANNTWAWIVGIILILVGIIGFFNAPVLGIFGVNTLHNVVHLITGLIFVWGAWKGPVKQVNTWLGVVYILVAILGFFGVLGFLAVNGADNWLHLVIGVVSALIGWKAS